MNNIKYLNSQKPMTAAGVGCTRLELWLVDLPKPSNDTHVQYGVRPAIVISNDAANENSPAVTVIPLTSNRKKGQLPTHVFVSNPGLTCSSRSICAKESWRMAAFAPMNFRDFSNFSNSSSGIFSPVS